MRTARSGPTSRETRTSMMSAARHCSPRKEHDARMPRYARRQSRAELAKIDSGTLQARLEQTSLRDLISDTLATFQPQAERRGVSLAGEMADAVDPMLIDSAKIQPVLHNSLDNAPRHTPTGGRIGLGSSTENGRGRVEITDTGSGITSEDLPHVFERAFRSERSPAPHPADGPPGAGLGLTIARGLIEAHDREPIRVRLPVSLHPPARLNHATPAPPPPCC